MKFGHGIFLFTFDSSARQNCNLLSRTALPAILLLLAAALLTSSSAPAAPPPNTSNLTVTPSDVSFGDVPIGSSRSQTITIRNELRVVATLSPLSVLGTGFKLANLTDSLSIEPGKSLTFNVVFAPTKLEKYSGSVYLVTGGINPTSIPLSGAGVSRVLSLSVSKSNLNFGDQTVGTRSTLPITITSSGNTDVTIWNIFITGASFRSSSVPKGTVLAPAQSITLDAAFEPTSLGSSIGKISIVSTATASPNIVLAGTAIAATTATSTSPSVSLEWNSVSDAVGYFVYRSSRSGGPYTKLNSTSVSVAKYVDSAVALGETYYYVVTALNSEDEQSSYSNQAEASIPDSGTAQSAPLPSIDLRWNGASQAVGYYVYRATNSGGPYTKLNSAAVAAESFVDSAVSAGETYYYVVTALNPENEQSSYSNQAEASIP
jgi:hypothetical protein